MGKRVELDLALVEELAASGATHERAAARLGIAVSTFTARVGQNQAARAAWQRGLRAKNLSAGTSPADERARRVLDLIRRRPNVTRREIKEQIGLDYRQLEDALYRLEHVERVVVHSESKAGIDLFRAIS